MQTTKSTKTIEDLGKDGTIMGFGVNEDARGKFCVLFTRRGKGVPRGEEFRLGPNDYLSMGAVGEA